MVISPSKSTVSKKKNIVKMHKATLAKKMKVEMIRYCMVWNYNDKQSVAYFAERGVSLSIPYYYELKAEYLSDEATKGWYTEQALFAMENTHRMSVEQLDELIKVTMMEIRQLQGTTVYINTGSAEFPKMVLNEDHDTMALAKMMDTLSNLIKLRDDMLAATPVVQAIMNKHAIDKEKSMVTN